MAPERARVRKSISMLVPVCVLHACVVCSLGYQPPQEQVVDVESSETFTQPWWDCKMSWLLKPN